MLNTICFFEIPGDDPEKLQGFYREMFDWGFKKVSEDFRYYSIQTKSDTPKGGLTARQDEKHTPVFYVKVKSIVDAVGKAEGLGGQTQVPKRPVPGVGWYAVLLDPQGNRIGLWEDDANAR
ncbi:MAG: VOC family protein [Desulfomonilaceae bacterium]